MSTRLRTDLPIEPLIPEILGALAAARNLVLEAPPGGGKTTRVPLALLDADWAKRGKIIVLEPRRLAARGAAARMAAMLGEEVGETVGYRVRLDRKVGPKTRIEVVTTGLFLRQLQGDPALPGVAAILFDEFHERTIEGDMALAFALEAQAGLRDDLRLVVMSATLDGESVAQRIPGSRRLRSEGRAFPVETLHLGDDAQARLEDRVAAAIRRALAEESGDILAFLPGTAEIRRTQDRLASEDRATVLPLYGDLPLAEQDKAIRRDRQGRRKVILATAIAETSLTIDGVHVVVDSGLRRSPRFDPAGGMSRLVTIKASLAATAQRRGRAGRTAPGMCYRLWSAASERALPTFDAPEIEAADLAPLALELAVWGLADPALLTLMTPPPAAALSQARGLLRQLEAIDASNLATAHGRRMAELGVHPRLAHMMVRSQERGLGDLACDIAAILSERDLLKGRESDADLRHRVQLLRGDSNDPALDRNQRARVRQSAVDWRRQLGVEKEAQSPVAQSGQVLALAYPDRLAQRRGGVGQFRLSNGRGAMLRPHDPLAAEDFLAVGSLDGDARQARIFLAAPITLAEIEEDFAGAIETRDQLVWNTRSEVVDAKRERRLWFLVLEEKPLKNLQPDQVAAAMVEGIRAMGLETLPWTANARSLQARIAFLRRVGDARHAWPDLSDAALLAGLEEWLAPYLSGMTRRTHLANLDVTEALLACLDWKQRQALDALAPTHLAVPSGSRVPLDYQSGEVPVLAVRLQEMFGATETPAIAGGKVQVLLHLLSPARRPVQVTRDLTSFWANSYRAVKADLKGQYPKHHWPDDPLQAEPTARAKPRPR
ncbi:MAG TPA: ATP-dependent helicase HrpB [Dongiaceae bacterium]|nr:ATP-dependent helicase HrpB [Dongiaceae bacterium]